MDFVVVGFGLGALGVLLGIVMLGWLAPRSQRAAVRVSSAEDAARCRAVAAEHRATGQAFLYAGGAMLLVTVAGLLGSLDDRTGALLVTTTATVAAVGILFGGYLHRARHPLPPRRRTHSAPAPSASMATAPPAVAAPWFLADEPSPIPDSEAESDGEGPRVEILPASVSGQAAVCTDEIAPLPSAVGATLSSGGADPAPRDESLLTAQSFDSESWQSADNSEPSPTRPDDEDPSSGHS